MLNKFIEKTNYLLSVHILNQFSRRSHLTIKYFALA